MTPEQPFSTTFTATGGSPPYTWSAINLPSGFTINSATGVVSGSAGAVDTGTTNPLIDSGKTMITVQDSSDPVRTTTAEYTFQVS